MKRTNESIGLTHHHSGIFFDRRGRGDDRRQFHGDRLGANDLIEMIFHGFRRIFGNVVKTLRQTRLTFEGRVFLLLIDRLVRRRRISVRDEGSQIFRRGRQIRAARFLVQRRSTQRTLNLFDQRTCISDGRALARNALMTVGIREIFGVQFADEVSSRRQSMRIRRGQRHLAAIEHVVHRIDIEFLLRERFFHVVRRISSGMIDQMARFQRSRRNRWSRMSRLRVVIGPFVFL